MAGEKPGCGKRKRGTYCAAAWCSNFAGCRIDQPISFFTFPKEKSRSIEWLKFALREDLMEGEMKNLRLCSDHFLKSDFRSTTPRVLLTKDAMPSQFEYNLVGHPCPQQQEGMLQQESGVHELQESGVHEVPTSSLASDTVSSSMATLENDGGKIGDPSVSGSVLDSETPAPSTPVPDTPVPNAPCAMGTKICSTPRRRCPTRSQPTPRTEKRIRGYKKSIARLRTNLFREKRKKAQKEKVERRQLAEISQKYLPTSAHKLLMAQLSLSQVGKYGRRWSTYMKDFALSLYYHGPRAYRFLQKTLCLPSVRSLLSWQKKVVVAPGIDNNAMAALEAHAKNLTGPDLLVSLAFDEVAIRENLFYDRSLDRVLGFCDYGDSENSTVGNQCLVLMVKGITKKWKQCIGYWVTHESTSADVLKNIVLECIYRLSSLDFKVKVMLCDQGPHNLKLKRNLGITPEAPFFMVGGDKIFFMFDPPHLLKSMRNNLYRYDFNFNGTLVQWCHLRSLFELTDPLKLKMMPKITKFHVDVKAFKKMKVKLASQVFSNSVSVAMSAFVAMGKLRGEAVHTANFFEFMDKLFDSFNSSQVVAHPFKYRYAMGGDTPHVAFLENAKKLLENSLFLGCKRQPASLGGWVLSISSLLELFKELKDQCGIPKLCTRVLNQDALENLFSVVRQQHGCNDNPTVMQFGRGYKHLLLTSISKLSNFSNCELDLEHFLVKISDFDAIARCTTDSQPEVEVDFSDLNVSTDLDIDELNVIYYVSGFLCKMFLKRHDCSACKEAMVKGSAVGFPTGHDIFLNLKGRDEFGGKLISVKTEVFLVIQEWEAIFQAMFVESVHRKCLGAYLKEVIKRGSKRYDSFTLPCEMAKDLLLNIYVQVRIFWGVRFLNQRR